MNRQAQANSDNNRDQNDNIQMNLPFGDKAYPFCLDELPGSSELARLGGDEWPDIVGSFFGPDDEILIPSDNSRLCQYHCGVGHCSAKLTEEEKANIKEIDEQLKRSALDKYPADSIGGMH